MKVQIFQVSKNFGKFRALDEISLSIPDGMFGLLGPNGAGKTTFFQLAASILYKSMGRASSGIVVK